MLLKWTLVTLLLISSPSAFSATQAGGFEDLSINLKLTYQSKDWLAFDAGDFVTAGSLFFAKPKSAELEKSSFSLRIDESPLIDAKKYVEKWLKDYPKFGFDILLSQKTQYGQFEGYEIELASKQNDKKIRQFVTKNTDNKFLIFTCSSDKNNFQTTLTACQKLLASAKKLTK